MLDKNEKLSRLLDILNDIYQNRLPFNRVLGLRIVQLEPDQVRLGFDKVFKGDKTLNKLTAAPSLKIHHLRIKFKDDKTKSFSLEDRKTATKFLNDLIHLKRQSEHLTLTTNTLSKTVPAISAYDLLKAMFIVVLVQMCQKKFGIVNPRM